MPPGLSPVHLLVIFLVALIVLGPEKGPQAIGKGARLLGEAKQWIVRASEELETAVSSQTGELTAPSVQAPTVAFAGDAFAADAEPPDRPPSDESAPAAVKPVSDAAAATDAVAPSSPPGPFGADRPPVHEEPHL